METVSALLALCEGNPLVNDGFPSQGGGGGSNAGFGGFFDVKLNKRLNQQTRCRWLETLSRSLWRHCDVQMCIFMHNDDNM